MECNDDLLCFSVLQCNPRSARGEFIAALVHSPRTDAPESGTNAFSILKLHYIFLIALKIQRKTT